MRSCSDRIKLDRLGQNQVGSGLVQRWGGRPSLTRTRRSGRKRWAATAPPPSDAATLRSAVALPTLGAFSHSGRFGCRPDRPAAWSIGPLYNARRPDCSAVARRNLNPNPKPYTAARRWRSTTPTRRAASCSATASLTRRRRGPPRRPVRVQKGVGILGAQPQRSGANSAQLQRSGGARAQQCGPPGGAPGGAPRGALRLRTVRCALRSVRCVS